MRQGGNILVLRSFFAFLVSGAEAAGPDWAATRAALVDLAEGSLVAALGCSYDMRVSVCGWFGGFGMWPF